jgi:hypothetical protein
MIAASIYEGGIYCVPRTQLGVPEGAIVRAFFEHEYTPRSMDYWNADEVTIGTFCLLVAHALGYEPPCADADADGLWEAFPGLCDAAIEMAYILGLNKHPKFDSPSLISGTISRILRHCNEPEINAAEEELIEASDNSELHGELTTLIEQQTKGWKVTSSLSPVTQELLRTMRSLIGT